jgi:hypothetical protein
MISTLRTPYLTIRRLFWLLSPLPPPGLDRDLVLMRRAGVVLDTHHDGTRPTIKGIRLAKSILKNHTMSTHAIRSMSRERDAELRAQSERAAAEVMAEQAQSAGRGRS